MSRVPTEDTFSNTAQKHPHTEEDIEVIYGLSDVPIIFFSLMWNNRNTGRLPLFFIHDSNEVKGSVITSERILQPFRVKVRQLSKFERNFQTN